MTRRTKLGLLLAALLAALAGLWGVVQVLERRQDDRLDEIHESFERMLADEPPASSAEPCQGRARVNRAWRFRGGATIEPAPGAALLAIDLTISGLTRVSPVLTSADGRPQDTAFQVVLLDEAGSPLNRFHQTWGEAPLFERIALVGAMEQGLQDFVLGLGPGCELTLRIEPEGPAWPPLPTTRVLRWGALGERHWVALVESRDFLAREWPAPSLEVLLAPRPGVLEQRLSWPSHALAQVSADGRRPERAAGPVRRYLAQFPRRPGDPLPTSYLCTVGVCEPQPLPPPEVMELTPELARELERSFQVGVEQDSAAQLVLANEGEPASDGGTERPIPRR